MIENLHKLQNGTDVRGIAIKNSEKKVNLTTVEVKCIAKGFATWLSKRYHNKKIKVAVGMDSRLSGPELREEVIKTLKDCNIDVYDCEMATTPAMFMTTKLEDYMCFGAIMITASHLPYYYNGMKFFTKEGGCEKEDIKEILDLAEIEINLTEDKGTLIKKNLIEDYSKVLVSKIREGVNSKNNYNEPLKGLKIIVDAGNGAGGFFASKVLEKLGANTEGSQFLDPDGTFPNHIPNPENKGAMDSITKAVLESKADLGIIFDTDVDRAAIVGADGSQINKNALIALISEIILEEHPKSIVVTDSITSDGLREFIEARGGIHHRFKRGYKNVINEAIRLNNEGKESHLAIETSGHAAIKENYFLDDGAYLIAKILIKMAKMNTEGKKLIDLIKYLKHPLESIEKRFTISTENFKEYGINIIEDLKDYINEVEGFSIVLNNYEGLKINCSEKAGDGWFLIRLSLHEPILALNIESNKINGSNKIYNTLKIFLERYKSIIID